MSKVARFKAPALTDGDYYTTIYNGASEEDKQIYARVIESANVTCAAWKAAKLAKEASTA
jgi:hypothetical protein